MRDAVRQGLRTGLAGLLFATLLAMTGCGSSTGTISGKVSYKDAPLKGGNVTFLTKDKKVSRLSEIQEDGSYKIEKMPAGEVLISVETASLKPPPASRFVNAPPAGANAPPGYKAPDFKEKAKRYVEIPEMYSDPDKSKLTYTVKGGEQNFDIKLP